MRRGIVTACGLLMLMTSFATPQGPLKASIEGVVVDAGTGGPIPNARLILTRSDTVPGPLAPPVLPVTTTDREGNYVFAGLEAGAYRVAAAAEGYVRQEYGQIVLGRSQGTVLTL